MHKSRALFFIGLAIICFVEVKGSPGDIDIRPYRRHSHKGGYVGGYKGDYVKAGILAEKALEIGEDALIAKEEALLVKRKFEITEIITIAVKSIIAIVEKTIAENTLILDKLIKTFIVTQYKDLKLVYADVVKIIKLKIEAQNKILAVIATAFAKIVKETAEKIRELITIFKIKEGSGLRKAIIDVFAGLKVFLAKEQASFNYGVSQYVKFVRDIWGYLGKELTGKLGLYGIGLKKVFDTKEVALDVAVAGVWKCFIKTVADLFEGRLSLFRDFSIGLSTDYDKTYEKEYEKNYGRYYDKSYGRHYDTTYHATKHVHNTLRISKDFGSRIESCFLL